MKRFALVCLILFQCLYLSQSEKDFRQSPTNSTTAPTAPPKPSNVVSTTASPLLPGIRLPCSCGAGQCECCTGNILAQFNQKYCAKLAYDPDEFAISAVMSMNERVLFKRTISGKNPPPLCFSPPRFQSIRLCMEFSNIYFASRNVHICLDMEANWLDFTLVEWSFQCIRMGASGVAVVGPEAGGGVPTNPIDVVDQTDEDYDDSARNVIQTNKITIESNSSLVLHESLKIPPKNISESLIQVKKLANGNVVVGYGTLIT